MLRYSIALLLGTLLLALTLLCNCSNPKLPSDITEGLAKHNLETVVVMGINDFHGSLAPEPNKTHEEPGQEPIPYEWGGASILASHVKILRSQFGDRFLILDAGDEFQGTVESNLEEGAPVVQFFNQIGVRAAAIGNHEFDYGPVGPEGTPGDPLGAIKERMKESHYTHLAANIIEKSTGHPYPFPNTFPHLITPAGRLKLGIIGLSTLDTPNTTRPDQIKALAFTDLRDATLREAKILREKGAQIILLTAHVGLVCDPGKAHLSHIFRKSNDPQGRCKQKESYRESEMADLLNSLPPGTLDAVVSGHSHTMIHHWINGIPVIQGEARNHYYHLLYLTYDWTQNKLLSDRTRIEGPIPVCPKIFENQGDCNGAKPPPKHGRGELIPPTLHGKLVTPDLDTENLLAPVFEKYRPIKSKIIGQAARPIGHIRTQESEFGNLVTDIIRKKVNADFALFNPGGIRATLEPGPISYELLYNILPFENGISLLKLTGKELKLLIRIAENGARGYFPVSGLKLKLIHLDSDAPSNDLNGDGKISPWEVNRILDIRQENGSPLKDSQFYTLATVDFLVTGGDDMEWIMSQIPKERIQLDAGGLIRNAVIDFISQSGPLNSIDHPLVNPKKPRFVLVKWPKKYKGKKKP